MKKIKHFLLTTLAVLCSTLTTWATPYGGTPAAPTQISGNYANYDLSADFDGYYVISTAEELYGFAELVNGGTATAKGVLTADIVVNENVLNADGTLNGTPTHRWTPIGTSSKRFSGTFDGNGHTISGLYFNNTTNSNYPDGGIYVGLIGYTSAATIKNVGVIDSYIRGCMYVGGICGYAGTQTNCFNTGTVSGSSNRIGGICGASGKETNCYNTGKVSGPSYVGGICGGYGTQKNCYNKGTVSGNSEVGSICGSEGSQTKCYYLAGSCSASGGGVSATAEEFASGKITYLLNGSTSGDNNKWRQNLDNDADSYPVLDDTHAVVYASQPCTSQFSNENNEARQEHSSMDATGHCTACGQYIAQGATLVTASNCSGLNLSADFVDYYAISNSADLYWFADFVNNGETDAKAVLTADIVVNEYVLNADGTLNGTPTYSWTPIGTYSKNYKGTFDGNGHTISGLYFNNATNGNYPNGGDYVGLIGYGQAVTIKNVGVIDSYLKGRHCVGGICGSCNYQSTIINCHNAGTISGTDYIGGICGGYGTQTNCYNTGKVSGSSYVGGICGLNGTQNNCYYLSSCGGKNTLGTSVSAKDIANGRLTYLLNGSTSEGNLTWYQTLGDGGDAYPVLDNTHGVVYTTQPCVSFGNISGVTVDHVFENGQCTVCGECVCVDGVYQLANADHLYWFAGQVNGGRNTINAILTDNIVVNSNVLTAEGELNGDGTNFETWVPIGTSTYKYAGTFDGNGHTISGLYFSKTANSDYPSGGNNVGLIGYCRGATIKNVGLIDSYIKGYTCVGGICGYASNPTITNCYNTATVLGSYDVGGICGEGVGLSQEKCHNSGMVSGIRFVGGICGYSNYNSSTNCYNTGMVSCSDYSVGGICGYGDGSQINCYNTGTVSGNSNVGGICGSGCTQYNCYYLESCGSMNALGISVTAEELASGKITYLLNGSTSEGDFAWYQTLGDDGDACPVLDNTHAVVYTSHPCTSKFSNTEGAVKNHPSMNAIGHCTACDLLIAQGATLITESNYSSFNLTADFIEYYAINNASDLYWFADLVNNSKPTANAVLTADIVVNENVLNDDGTLNETPTYSWTPIGIKGSYFEGTFDGNGHTISGLYFNSTINADYPAGGNTVGLIGQANESTIKNVGVIDSYIRGFYNVGSICGGGWHATITNCYNTGTVLGSNHVGGICGEYGTITNCHNEGQVSGNYVGGVCGIYGTVSNCYNTGRISANNIAGGICYSDGTVTNCYNTGTVSSSSYAGAICRVNGTVTNCYYLAGSCSSSGGGVSATAEEFANGKIGYLLNKDNNNAWYQDLYSDDYPLLDNTHNLVSGYIEEVDDTYTVVGDVLLATNYEIAEGKTLSIPEGASLTTTGEAVITNNGTMVCNGTITGNNLAGDGSFLFNNLLAETDFVLNTTSYTYRGTAFTFEDGIDYTFGRAYCGKLFTFDGTYTVSYSDNLNVGEATISITNDTDNENVVNKSFTITPKDVELVWENTELTYNGSAQKPTATATGMVKDESLTVTVSGEQTNANTDTYTATASITDNNYKLPDDATIEFTINPKEVTLEWGESTFTYNGEAQKPTATASGMVNDESLTVTVSGEQINANTDTETYTATASITDNNYKLPEVNTKEFTINPKAVTLEWGESTFTYNGSAQKPTATATGMVNDENLTVTVSGEQTNANTDTETYTATASITDNNYKLPEVNTKEFTINPKEVTLEWSNTALAYNGEAQAPTATATGLIEGDVCTVTVSGAQINAGTAYTATASALSNANYKLPNAVTATFSIGKATPSYTKPENLTINCKQTLADITLPTGFTFENENAALKIGGNTVTVSFTPENVDNYNVVSGIELKVTKAHSAVTDVAVPATCTTDGHTEGLHCEICNEVLVAQEVILAGHTPGAAVAENLKAATCTEVGSVDSVVYCTVCKTELSRKTVEIPVIPHTAGEAVAENLKEATCTEAGSVDSVVYCTVCKKELSRKTVELPVVPHTAGEAVAENLKEATCTEAGSVDSVVYCTVCKAELSRKTVVIEAAGHKADSIVIENVVAATYTAAGSYDSVVYCSVCKVELSRTTIVVPQLVAPKIEAEVVISQLDYTVGDSLKLDGGKIVIATSDSTTAEVVITPEMVSGFNPDSVGVQTVTVAFEIDGVAYTTTFDVEVKEAAVIEVVAKSVVLSAPTKVVYKKGELLDVAGGKLTVTYSNGTTQDVELKADMVSGFDAEKVGAQQLTVTLTVDKVVLTASFDVTIEADDDTAISDDEAAAVNIYAYQNVIVVESADALEGEISIFDVNGRMVAKELAAGSRTEIMMQHQGIYIVKVNNTAKRVMVY